MEAAIRDIEAIGRMLIDAAGVVISRIIHDLIFTFNFYRQGEI